MALLDLFAGRLGLFHLIKFLGFILISQRSFDFLFSKVPIFCGHSTRNAKRPLHCVFSLYPWKELQTQDYQDTVGYSKGNDFQTYRACDLVRARRVKGGHSNDLLFYEKTVGLRIRSSDDFYEVTFYKSKL